MFLGSVSDITASFLYFLVLALSSLSQLGILSLVTHRHNYIYALHQAGQLHRIETIYTDICGPFLMKTVDDFDSFITSMFGLQDNPI